MMKICPCGVSFKPNYPEQVYHSLPCFLGRYNRANLDGHANRGARLGGAVRGAQRRGTGKGYLKVPGQDVHKHRAVAEEALGRTLYSKEVVHHEDLNKQNNSRENLIVFPSQADHARHHKLKHCGSPCGCPGIRLGVMPDAAS